MLRLPYIPDDSQKMQETENFIESLYLATSSAINSMPDGIEKSILIDRELNSMKGNEIAEKYQMNLNTVKTKIRKARKTIKESVVELHPELTDFIKDNY
jgi:DNA-directed RNA polymerase specialized sigma24 family protein